MVMLFPGPVQSERVTAFTLRTALTWSGHVCTGRCPPSITSIPAQSWVVRNLRGGDLWTTDGPPEVDRVLLVDFGASDRSAVSIARLLADVNVCVAPDRLYVCDITS